MKSIDKMQKKFLAFFLSAALAASIAALSLFREEDLTVKAVPLNSFQKSDDRFISYKVESEQCDEKGNLVISGWAVKPGLTYSYYNYGNDETRTGVYNNMHIGFTDDKNVYVLPTKLSQRNDVDQLINDGIDYGYCGFTAQLPKSKAEYAEGGSLVLIWENRDGSQELYYL